MFVRCRVFLRSRMFDRCGVFLRSRMFDRCGVFFFLEMWRESLIFERDGSWFGASHQKGSKVRSRIFLVHRLDRAFFFPTRTSELELKIDRLFLKDKRTS